MLDSFTTMADGFYNFPALLEGTYTVAVDKSTLPEFYDNGPCNVGADDEIDNDCTPVTLTIASFELVDHLDFGFVGCNGEGVAIEGDTGLGHVEDRPE